jgi:ribosomal protein S3AE
MAELPLSLQNTVYIITKNRESWHMQEFIRELIKKKIRYKIQKEC